MDEGIPYMTDAETQRTADYIRWALGNIAPGQTKEQECRDYLLALGYRIESPTEQAMKQVQAQWIVAGIDKGE
jgi:hypothetical protein